MIYLVQEDKHINKYEVSFDKEKLNEIKYALIENCSAIVHWKYEDTKEYVSFENSIIKNYKSTPLGKKECTDQYGSKVVKDIFLCEYDQYNVPVLVDLIDQLLKGCDSALDSILSYAPYSWGPKIPIVKQLEKAKKEYIEIFYSGDKEQLMNALLKVGRLESELELNKNQKSQKPYYKELLNSISFEFIDSIEKEVVERTDDFFGTTLMEQTKAELPKTFMMKYD